MADVPDEAALRARCDEELARGWVLFVAARDDAIVAMLAIKPAVRVLDQLFVLPEEQRRGTGTRLLRLATALMPDGFVLRMAASNERARTFYQANGLMLVSTGVHPRHGYPVENYRWTGGEPCGGGAVTG